MGRAGERGDVRAVVRWAGHPGTLGAVLVLLLNDHVGKRVWPGAVTGKVSDLAWMLVSPVVLALLLTPLLRLRGDRPAIAGLAGTAVMFAVAKSGPAGGEIASRIWSLSGVPSRIRGDRSDLVALPLLGLSWWLWTRSRAARRSWRWPAALVVPLAVVAMVATSEGRSWSVMLWSAGGQPVLDTPEGRWTTRDGGATWTRVERQDTDRSGPRESRPQDGHCVPVDPLRCFRLLDSSAPIEISEDGGHGWRPVFDPGQLPRGLPSASPSALPSALPSVLPSVLLSTAATSSPSPSLGWPTDGGYRYPAELLVVTVPDGWVVLAHYLRYGVVRGTPDGTWSFQEYPDRRTTPRSE